MSISIIFVVLSVLALLFLVRVAKGRTTAPLPAENSADYFRPVDLDAFRNLIDPEEEDYLRRELQPGEFRRIQRERLHAAAEYISCAAHNAALLLRIAEAARQSPDPAVAAMAEKLVGEGIRLRLYAFQAIPRLYVAMLLPARRLSPVRMADRYEHMTRQVVLLGLRYPVGGASGAL
jgi:hypothetical protein